MVVLTSVPGIKVAIKVNGKTAEEYDIPNDEAPDQEPKKYHLPENADPPLELPDIVKYIEAKPGEKYTFHIVKNANFARTSHHIAYRCYADTLQLALHQEIEDKSDPTTRWEARSGALMTRSPTGEYITHHLQFAPLQVGMTRPSCSIRWPTAT